MMKSFLRTIVPALLLVGLTSSTAWGQVRIGTVDLRKVFEGYWKTKQADASLKDRAADIEKEHKTMMDDWKKSKEDYQKLLTEANDQNLSVEERDKRKKTAEDKFKQIRDSEEAIGQYERQARTTIDEQRKRMRDSLVDEIRTIVSGRAKTAGYTLVLDTASESINGTPVVVFSNNENDITEMVLSQLNAGAPTDAPKSDAKADDKKKDKK